MLNLIKLADHLIEEADRMAAHALQTKDPKHIDIVLKFCDAHQEICESLDFHEDYSSADHHEGGMWSDNPRPHRRR